MSNTPDSIADLMASVIKFRDERDWKQFHDPKNVSISLTLEAAELLEIFQWSRSPQTREFLEEKHTEIEDELADIFYWVLLLSNDLGINLGAALERKLIENGKKYPVSLARGRAEKYDKLGPNR